MMRPVACFLCLALFSLPAAAATSAPVPAAPHSVTTDVLHAGLFDGVTQPETFVYRYDMKASSMKKPFTSEGKMEVRKIADDGSKEVYFDLFKGKNRRQLGPLTAKEFNPLILVFLQLDVNEMGHITGGSPIYFQQQVRKGFNDPAEEKQIEVEVGGRKVTATQIKMRPFEQDPNIKRFPAFKEKTYEFVVSKDVPGGLARIAAITPDPRTGELVVEKSLSFEKVE